MRRHLEAAELDQPLPSRGAVGRIELVDAELGAVRVAGDVGEQVAEQAVDQPRLRHFSGGHLLEGDFEFVEPFGATFVDARRLAGGADEQAAEQIGQARVVLPVGDDAAQQVGPAQEGTVGRRGAAEGDVVAATGAAVATVEHEFLGAEARLACFFVERGGDVFQFFPVVPPAAR